MKKHGKIILSLIVAIAVILTAGLIAFFDFSHLGNDEIAFNEENIKVSNLASTEVVPTFYYQYYIIGDPNVNNPLKPLTNNLEEEYAGQSNPFKVIAIVEGNEEVKFTIKKQEKIDGAYVDMPTDKDFVNAGEYKVIATVVTPNYTIKGGTEEVTFKILPYKCELAITSDRFEYNGEKQAVKIDTVGSAPKDNKFWEESIEAEDPLHPGTYIPVENAVNAGKYRVKVDVTNKNYIVINKEQIESNYIYFEIEKAKLVVYHHLDNNEYTASNKTFTTVTYGIFGKDEISISYKYFFNEELEVENIRNAGKYKLVGTCANSNYYVEDSYITVTKKPVRVWFELPPNLIYDGSDRSVKIKQEGLYEIDNIELVPTYTKNGVTVEKPRSAGIYNISYTPKGDMKANYTFNNVVTTMKITKAQYPVNDFKVVIHAIKVIVVEDEVLKQYNVRYSLDGKTWQKEATISANPMQRYTVFVKILEDDNHFEKILTREVKTGFDPVIFAEYMNKVNLDNFSFKDCATVNEIKRCEGYILPTDVDSVDYDKLNKIYSAHEVYLSKTQGVLDDAVRIGNSMKFYYATPIAAGIIGVGMLLRRRRHEK